MTTLSRRRFAQLLTLGTSAALLPERAFALGTKSWRDEGYSADPLPRTPASPTERYWEDVRSRYLIPRDVGFLNAANLCPMSLPVVEALERHARAYEVNPAPGPRTTLIHDGREESRNLVAAMFRVSPEEIVITRNTTEGNNLVSSGLQLGAGDEVIVFAENHPSNLNAWREKAKRFGFTVVTVEAMSPHPGTEAFVQAFATAITPRTKVMAITHVTASAGDLLPARELCALARSRGVLSLVDGAQAFGVLDIDLSDMRPDFYTGSAHKWPCGPKETGALFVAREVHERIWPSVIGVYPGAVGISRKLEGMGQRDDVAYVGLAEALRFRNSIGRDVVERRGRELAATLREGLSKLDGVTMWTHADPARSAAIVTFRPGTLDLRRLSAALIEKDRIVVTVRNGEDRPGLRLSPHVYNTAEDVDRTIATMKKYLASGV